jgi:hypothetical protein
MVRAGKEDNHWGYVLRQLGKTFRAESVDIVQQALPDRWKELAEQIGNVHRGSADSHGSKNER